MKEEGDEEEDLRDDDQSRNDVLRKNHHQATVHTTSIVIKANLNIVIIIFLENKECMKTNSLEMMKKSDIMIISENMEKFKSIEIIEDTYSARIIITGHLNVYSIWNTISLNCTYLCFIYCSVVSNGRVEAELRVLQFMVTYMEPSIVAEVEFSL